jgi:hypothetical protein
MLASVKLDDAQGKGLCTTPFARATTTHGANSTFNLSFCDPKGNKSTIHPFLNVATI